ncbi:hypothetical protein GH741_00915 [Aquibacillus halophilus]|uniref:O-antigen ligase domain-containing protein n=1 Tax=Aquibacillus halophilus TaxID=930132 RepID=A0A6A8D7H7_9BACI|nr:hypothetical protein [Aquibacillus halophilus]MRH41230.1 hypothetical protein [Aquibacillus halophilus]
MKFRKIASDEVWNVYYFVVLLGYLLAVFYTNIPVGILATTYMMILVIDLFRKGIIIQRYFDLLILAYVFFSIISLLWYPIGKIPIQAYVVEITYGILPICFYFYGKVDKSASFLPNFFKAICLSLIVGIIFYIWAPMWYGNYLVEIGYSSNNQPSWIRSSLYSIYGATIASSFATMLFFYSFMGLAQKGSKEKWLYWLYLIVSMIALILGLRRSALLGSFIIIIILHFFLYVKWRRLKATHFIYELLIVIGTLILGWWLFPLQFEMLVTRIEMFSTAVSSRSDQWELGLGLVTNHLIGLGLGAVSHTAGAYGFPAVHDGSIVRMYVEIGIIGVGIFLAIVTIAILRGLFEARSKIIELGIILLLLFQATGSNVLVFQLLAPIFWYSIGRCISKQDNKGLADLRNSK